jgi:hypothetical protein
MRAAQLNPKRNCKYDFVLIPRHPLVMNSPHAPGARAPRSARGLSSGSGCRGYGRGRTTAARRPGGAGRTSGRGGGARAAHPRIVIRHAVRPRDGAAVRLSAEIRLAHTPAASGEMVAGICRQRLALTSGRFVVINNGPDLALVPWTLTPGPISAVMSPASPRRTLGSDDVSGASAGERPLHRFVSVIINMSTIVQTLPLHSDTGRSIWRRPPATIRYFVCLGVRRRPGFWTRGHAATVKLIGGLAPNGIRLLADRQLGHVAGGSEGAADAAEGESEGKKARRV